MSVNIQNYSPQSMWHLYQSLLNPLADIFAKAEQRGIRVDIAKTKQMDKELSYKLQQLEKEFYNKYGYYNYNSPNDCVNLLIHKLGCKPLKKTAGGAISITKETLDFYANEGVEAAEDIRNLKRLNKIINTYLRNYILKNVDSDGIIHVNYNMTGTVTGRLSSSGGDNDDSAFNAQNITRNIKLKDGTIISIRSLFIPRKGYQFVHRDASQSELRMLGWYSADPFLLDACEKNRDLHAANTYSILGKILNFTMEELEKGYKAGDIYYKELRQLGKNTGFAIVYGAKDKKLYQMLGGKIALEDIPTVVNNYFENMPNVLEWKKVLHKLAVEHDNEFFTYFGRRRVLLDLLSPNEMNKLNNVKNFNKEAYRNYEISAAALREGINFIIQSTSVDYTNYGIVECNETTELDQSKFFTLLQTHDSVDDEVLEEYIPEYIETTKPIYTKPKGAINVKMKYDVEVVGCLQ